jgi:two-component system chemotaxis response regulator CheB
MMNDEPIRVLVVDDTVVYRKIVSDILMELPSVEAIGTAHNGKIAMAKIASLKPDLLTLDLEMPEMNGLEVLAAIKKEAPDVAAIMLSTLTHKGGEMTIKALELGAFDFIPKPQAGTMEENKAVIKDALAPMLKAFSRQNQIKRILRGRPPYQGAAAQEKQGPIQGGPVLRANGIPAQKGHSEIVGIGISTGGPHALAQMMPKLPPNLGVPILIVQHMPPIFTRSLAASLNSKCAIEVREAADREPLQPNTALIAPGRTQMKVVGAGDGENRIIRITDDPPENSCKPSADYLFRSIAHLYMGRATGVIMTGMGSDGTLGLKLMKRNGATIIAQDEATCIVYGMPKEAIEKGIVDVISPLDKISEEICRTVKSSNS